MRAVSSLPSVPARGDVLMPMVIERLGSSTCRGSRAIGFSGSARVSPMKMSSKPATATMSPGPAL